MLINTRYGCRRRYYQYLVCFFSLSLSFSITSWGISHIYTHTRTIHTWHVESRRCPNWLFSMCFHNKISPHYSLYLFRNRIGFFDFQISIEYPVTIYENLFWFFVLFVIIIMFCHHCNNIIIYVYILHLCWIIYWLAFREFITSMYVLLRVIIEKKFRWISIVPLRACLLFAGLWAYVNIRYWCLFVSLIRTAFCGYKNNYIYQCQC